MTSESGEVELPLDPQSTFDTAAMLALEDFLFSRGEERALDRMEALEVIVDAWRDVDTPSELEAWTRTWGQESQIHVGATDDGSLELCASNNRSADDHLRHVEVPRSVITTLIARVATPSDVSVMVESLADLLGEWTSLTVDDEKLVGHLVLVHSVDLPRQDLEGIDMFQYHWQLHRESRAT